MDSTIERTFIVKSQKAIPLYSWAHRQHLPFKGTYDSFYKWVLDAN